MSLLNFLQQREYGSRKGRKVSSMMQVEDLVEEKVSKSFVNKACSVSGHCRSTFITEFSPDGTKIASSHGDHTVRVTDIATGQCIRTLRGHPRTPWCLAYHPSSSHILASGCLSGQVRIWDLYGYGCEVWQTENTTVIAALTFHPVDHVLIIAAGNTIYFWDWSQPEPFARCSTAHEYERIRWLRFDHLGMNLYTGISNNTAGHREEVTNVSINSRSRNLPSRTQSTQLTSAYNSILNCFQEFQHNSVLNQVTPQGGFRRRQSSVRPGVSGYPVASVASSLGSQTPSTSQTSPSAALRNLEKIHQKIRQNELLMASYASRLSSHQAAKKQRSDEASASASGSQDEGQSSSSTASVLADQQDLSSDDVGQRSESGERLTTELTPEQGSSQPVSSEQLITNSDPFLSSADNFSARAIANSNSSGPSNSASSSLDVLRENAAHLENIAESLTSHANDQLNTVTNRSAEDFRNSTQRQNWLDTVRSASYLDKEAERKLNRLFHLKGSLRREEKKRSQANKRSCSERSSSSKSSTTKDTTSDTVPLLTQYLQAHRSKHEESTPSAARGSGFLNIRDRLKLPIPFSSESLTLSSGASSEMRVPSVNVSGIPQVTILSASTSNSSCDSYNRLRCSATVSSENSRISSMSESRDPVDWSESSGQDSVLEIPAVNIVPACDVTSTVGPLRVPVVTLETSTCGVGSVTSESNMSVSQTSSSNVHDTTGHDTTARNTASGASDQVNKDRMSRQLNERLGDCYSRTVRDLNSRTQSHSSTISSSASVSVSDSGNSTFHVSQPSTRASAIFRGRSLLSSYRMDPYQTNWRQQVPSSSLSSSIMGPYLQSRGIDISGGEGLQNSSQSSTVSGSSVIDRALSRVTSSDWNRVSTPVSNSQTDSMSTMREQASSSDTETELSAHLPHSGAYFMPISRDPLRAGSSLSTTSASSADRSSDSRPCLRDSGSKSTQGEGSSGSRPASQEEAATPVHQGQEVELVVDQNDNYSASTRGSSTNSAEHLNEIRLEDNDRNNNSIHIVPVDSSAPSNTLSTGEAIGQQLEQSRNTVDSQLRNLTDRIERGMSSLSQRLSALQDSFTERYGQLGDNRRAARRSQLSLLSETATNLTPRQHPVDAEDDEPPIPRIEVPSLSDRTPHVAPGEQRLGQGDHHLLRISEYSSFLSQPPTLLETSLRSHRRGRQLYTASNTMLGDGEGVEPLQAEESRQDWRQLQRHYLHPHYSTSILDDTINRPNNAIQSAINRAIAGAFMGTGESAVANNIINQTHRIQFWDFSHCKIPDITSSTKNIVVPHCKLHNSASCDISQDSTLLATFVPSHQGFPDDNILAVFSLMPCSRGQCIYTKSFGPNAISISISPSTNHVLVGLAAKRLSWVFTTNQLVGQIYRLEKKNAGEQSMKHVKDIMHTCSLDLRTHVSGNSARWLPMPGQGVVYGTNRGDLHICRHGVKVVVDKAGSVETDITVDNLSNMGNIRRCLLRRVPWLNYPSPHRVSTSTQTTGVRQSASTQTDAE